ncbi:MAG: hypothetical protein KME02_05355 [Aphanothece saxicola GSE-SYN-MK-01-06B]|jgi:hypothetical protein|nr:hypothetical protein [Aphanothece saxicola GSE-SYN-MK-01-06B]
MDRQDPDRLSHWEGRSFLGSPAPVLLVWLCLYAARPFFLGLYHDDWVIYLDSPSWNNTNATFWLFANRPILGFYHIGTSWLAQGHIAILHLFAALTVLATALILRRFLVAVISYAFRQNSRVGCNIAACLWLMMPWTLGTTAWIITNPTLMSVLGFGLAGLTLLNHWRYQDQLLPWLPVSLLISALSYEMFIAQLPLLLGLYYLDEDRKPRRLPPYLPRIVLITLASLSVAFVSRASLERLGKLLDMKAPMKSFNPEWLSLFLRNLRPDWLLQAFPGQESTITPTIILIIGLIILVFVRSIDREGRRFKRLLLSALIALTGYSLSCLVPALAGYALSGVGLDSRVTIGASFWMAFFLAFIFSEAADRSDWTTKLSWMVAIVLACSFTLAMVAQLSDWRVVWNSERALLRKLDISSHATLPENALVALDRPISRNGVYGFRSSWDLDFAIRDLSGRMDNATYLVAGDYWKVHANQGRVVQRAGTYVLAEYRPSMAWVLDVETGKLRPMAAQQVLGGSDYP